MCNKMSYSSKSDALKDYNLVRKTVRRKVTHAKMKAYKCDKCGLFHLYTIKSKKAYKNIRSIIKKRRELG